MAGGGIRVRHAGMHGAHTYLNDPEWLCAGVACWCIVLCAVHIRTAIVHHPCLLRQQMRQAACCDVDSSNTASHGRKPVGLLAHVGDTFKLCALYMAVKATFAWYCLCAQSY
jgi:hypothetical protein